MVTSIDQPLYDAVPSHVPPERVRMYDVYRRRTTPRNPFLDLSTWFQTGPDVFYTPDFFPKSDRGAWVPRRARQLRAIYADSENFTKNDHTRFASSIGESWAVIPTELDPPVHAGFRQALNPVFSPQRMARLHDWVVQRAQELIARFRDEGGCEFIADFAVPFPVSIFLDLMGLPQEEMEQLVGWERMLLRSGSMDEQRSAVHAVKAYLEAAIAERVKRPRDDLISNALQLEVDGRKWTREEIFGYCFNLYVGGLDTVTANIGIHVHHLATHPADQALLRAEPAKIVVAVEEFLRFYAPVTNMRIVTRDYPIDGIIMRPGDSVALPTALAGHDPEEYDSPDEVRLDRRAAHISLGFGPHRCLGQHLARRELQVAVGELLKGLPPFHISDDERVSFRTGGVVHVDCLPLSW